MIKENQLIEIVIAPMVYNWYISLGYKVKMWDKIQVPPIDLPPTSHHLITVICDVCGEEKRIQYRYYYNHIEKYGGQYHCPRCTAHLPEVKKIHNDGIKKSLLEKYGVSNPISVPGVVDKMKQTCRERYGVDYSTQSEQMKQKSKETLEKLGKIRTSKPQIELYNLLKTNFPGVKLNSTMGPYNLDCELIIDNVKIDVEYDGAFWHQNKSHDNQRDGFLKKNGYKILRIKGGIIIPDFTSIKEEIDILVNTSVKYREIVLPEWNKFFEKIAD